MPKNVIATQNNSNPVAPIEDLQMIPLASIAPHPNNPRKHFDPESLKELATSIQSHGVRQPILIRPNGEAGKYQLICGERRWRAAKIAGKDSIPAMIDANLTDSQALEIMVIENLQRENVPPLDEAIGLKMLLEQDKRSVEDIAAKLGKSLTYVYQRIKLASLIPAAQDALREDRMTAGHATLIARLQPTDQMKALEYTCQTITDWHTKEQYVETASIRELSEWIHTNVMLELANAPWELTDDKLVPDAGPCSSCAKHTAANPALFADLKTSGTLCKLCGIWATTSLSCWLLAGAQPA